MYEKICILPSGNQEAFEILWKLEQNFWFYFSLRAAQFCHTGSVSYLYTIA